MPLFVEILITLLLSGFFLNGVDSIMYKKQQKEDKTEITG